MHTSTLALPSRGEVTGLAGVCRVHTHPAGGLHLPGAPSCRKSAPRTLTLSLSRPLRPSLSGCRRC
jgi:hypothetical protein